MKAGDASRALEMLDQVLQFTSPLLADAFTLWGSPTSWLEVAGFVLSVWMVGCNMRVDPLGWPLAIASSLLYALLFLHSKLYGEASLQLFFVAVAGWGWLPPPPSNSTSQRLSLPLTQTDENLPIR